MALAGLGVHAARHEVDVHPDPRRDLVPGLPHLVDGDLGALEHLAHLGERVLARR
jgi:hypothetical protein